MKTDHNVLVLLSPHFIVTKDGSPGSRFNIAVIVSGSIDTSMVGWSNKDSEFQEVSQGGGFDDCRFDVFRCGDLINRKSLNRPIATSFNLS